MYDLIIVGGGPSGSTLARLLASKFKILLLEKKNTEKTDMIPNQKCCGGLLAPDAQKLLAVLGLGIPKYVLLGPQLFAVRTIDIQNGIERFYQRHYININREEFDKWLLSLVPNTVDIKTECTYYSHEEKDGEVTVYYYKNGKKYSEKTKILVGADGGFSKVRRQAIADDKEIQRYIAIQEWFETEKNMPYYGAIFDDEITDFYSWTIPKEDLLIVGAALKIDKKADEKFENLKQKLKDYGFKLGKSVKRNGAFILRPKSIAEVCTGNGNVALIGEAAGFISPSSAEGLSYALKSSLALARALRSGILGFDRRYKRNTKPIVHNIICKNLKCPAMYNSFLRRNILKSGIISLNIFE